jgi:hypothetical protein
MATTQPPPHADQNFRGVERLFRRVHRDNIKPDGKASFLAFELPDMSVNREDYSTAAEARRGFLPENWGVVSIKVGDMPPRESVPQIAHSYRFRARHAPEAGNFAHSEVRVWREDGEVVVLVTTRLVEDFLPTDPDREEPRAGVVSLDPDFHMRWRKKLEWRCQPELRPMDDMAS